jgi:hypothetical protein
MTRNREKLKTLVHYIAARLEDPALLGSIKLNKVLWVSDLWAYVGWGKPITGERYVKQQFGPVAMTLPALLTELQAEKKLVVRQTEAHGNPKVDYIALTRPENISDLFSADEISLVDEAIDFVCRLHTARQISDRSHDIIWELAEIGEGIPYEAMLACRLDAVTKDDVQWARGASERCAEPAT